MNGKLISFEGGEGGGKDTHIPLVEKYLIQEGFNVVSIKEPGTTDLGKKLRELILNPDINKNSFEELCLYIASRSCVTRKIIKPALERGEIVIANRLLDSSEAYQGYAGGINLDFVNEMNTRSLYGILPDLTFYLDVLPKTGLEKSTLDDFKEKDWQERKPQSFHEKVRFGYLEIAKREPDRVKIIQYIHDGIDVMQQKIRSYMDEILEIK